MSRAPSPIVQDPVARPQRADAKRNYDLLVAAADVAFTEHGAGASLEDIARRAGVGIGTLYRHFPTRDALLAQVLHDSNAAIIARATELRAAPSPIDGLARWLEAFVGHAMTYRGLGDTLAASFVGTGAPLCGACKDIAAAGATLVVRAQDAGEIRADVDVNDVIRGAQAAAWIAEQTKDADAARRHLSILLDGLRAEPARRTRTKRSR
jgi:AcrR family transcriptional regulator